MADLLALDDELRLKVVRKMYAMRFGEDPPQRRSVEQLRGIEGARVREMLQTSGRAVWGGMACPQLRYRAVGCRRSAEPLPFFCNSLFVRGD